MEVVKWCDRQDFARCELEDREAVIAEALEHKDVNVLIVNPPLVATGLDLISFNRLHFCGIPTYSVYIFEQSMCRLHRPGQQKKVTINFWVYGWNPTEGNAQENELQALAMAVMSDKVRASAVVTGSVGAALAALNQTQGDIMTTLRDVLLNGDTGHLTIAETEPQTAVKAPTKVNPLYAKIEALIEQYDDARQPVVEKIVSAHTPPLSPIVCHPELASVIAEPLPLLTTGVISEGEPDLDSDPLRLLMTDLGGVISDTSFAIQPQKSMLPPKIKYHRRQHVNLLDMPEDEPTSKLPPLRWLPNPCPDPAREGNQPETMPLREAVQLDLF
jgi:hypothetical protein